MGKSFLRAHSEGALTTPSIEPLYGCRDIVGGVFSKPDSASDVDRVFTAVGRCRAMYAGRRYVETTGGFKSGVKRKKLEINVENQQHMAERVGFEPTVRLTYNGFRDGATFGPSARDGAAFGTSSHATHFC